MVNDHPPLSDVNNDAGSSSMLLLNASETQYTMHLSIMHKAARAGKVTLQQHTLTYIMYTRIQLVLHSVLVPSMSTAR